MDNVIEQSIKRKNKTLVVVIRCFLKILTGVLVVVALLIPSIFLIHLILVAALTYYFSINTNIEYEYELKDEILSLNLIKNNKKRKELIAIEIKDLVAIAPSKTKPLKKYIGKKMKTLDLTSHSDGVKYYGMIVKEGKRETKILFEPNCNLLSRMKILAPGKVFIA